MTVQTLRFDPSQFRHLARAERVQVLVDCGLLPADRARELLDDVPVLPLAIAEQMIENVIGVFALPLAIVPGVMVNGKRYDVPMVIEEPSVVAAQANSAKLVRESGGYQAEWTAPQMIGQIQLVAVPDLDAAEAALAAARDEVLAAVDAALPGIAKRGGGARDLTWRRIVAPDGAGTMLVVHVVIDTCDAMGANAVNTAAEAIAPRLEALSGGRAVLRILSNLSDLRRAIATARIPVAALASARMTGREVAENIVWASMLAEVDPYRAATHNKGAMNGIDAVVLATGNDFRAVEAGAHAWAARDGVYRALSTWRIDGDSLVGRIELPLALGIVGGQVRTHPWVPLLLGLLDVASAGELAGLVAAVGLGQNLAALRALASVGIQAGHMAMHARAIALEVGARPDEVAAVAAALRESGSIDRATAAAVLAALRRG